MAVRRKMDGADSGLTQETVDQLGTLNELYDAETHGSQLSTAQNIGWLTGGAELAVVPAFSEMKAGLFLNRHVEVGWMAHRLLPLVQPSSLRLNEGWAANWNVLDRCYGEAVLSMTKQLGLPVGRAIAEFISKKFPFASQSTWR